MVGLTSLWLPILLSAIVVFILSSVIHMFLGYHNSDYARLPGDRLDVDGGVAKEIRVVVRLQMCTDVVGELCAF